MVEYNEVFHSQNSAGEIEKHMNQEDREEIVNSFLKVLTPDQRACIVLRNIEGLSYQEIAETLKININTVRSRLKRAREQLLAVRKKVVNDEL
jgi:RNA polymerase sigma-70 factor (ECF subfamily)